MNIKNTRTLLATRLHNQMLAVHDIKKPTEVVSHMGAMQSQSLDLAKWAIGVRIKNQTVNSIDEALNTGKIIRTHILRPTWHFVSAEDIHWMFDLSNPQLKPIYKYYGKNHVADETVIYQSIPLVVKALEGGKHLTKAELSDWLLSQNISVDTRYMTLILSYAEMEGLLVNGELRGNKQTFTLLEEWVPRKETLQREEALARLAQRFFASHAPATLHDFSWWSGLGLTECKQAIEMNKADLISTTFNGRVFWMRNDQQLPPDDMQSALLLPPFDEFVVSYKDRSEIIEDAHYAKVMTKNGLFSPTIMLNGEIVGSWKKTVKKDQVLIDLSFFKKTTKKTQELFRPEMERLKAFYEN